MVSNRWIESRQAHWRRLEELVLQARMGLGRLDGRELQQLGLLYRQTASDLSMVMNDPASTQLAAYLNSLLGRSHNLLYTGKSSGKGRILRFFVTYSQVFRRNLWAVAIATGLFLAAAVAGWAVSAVIPAFAGRFLGPAMIDSIEHRKMWTESVVAVKPVASSFITTNNLSVAFTTYALGITGIGTAWMMIFNGLMLGIVAEATWRAGMALSLWSFVAPHGVLELPAICIAGGAGLTLARGVFFPGLLPRREAVVRAGRESVQLLLGTIPMLLVAGTVEAFFSPTHVPLAMKFCLAALLFSALIVYLFGTLRSLGPRESRAPAQVALPPASAAFPSSLPTPKR